MSPKLKCHQKWNVPKTEMSPQLKRHQNWNIIKSEMSLKVKYHQNSYVTKTEMSQKVKCHQNRNITTTADKTSSKGCNFYSFPLFVEYVKTKTNMFSKSLKFPYSFLKNVQTWIHFFSHDGFLKGSHTRSKAASLLKFFKSAPPHMFLTLLI